VSTDDLIATFAHPAATSERLRSQIGFILEVDRLKTVLRQSTLLAENRRENDAEHSWHLALMTMVLAEYADAPVNVSRIIEMAIVHDLVEVYAGDTPLYGDVSADEQARRETVAADRLFTLLPNDQALRFRSLWDEFEARETAESRFAKAMDRLQPLLLNYGNRGGTWRTPGVDENVVRARKSVIRDGSAELWDYALTIIEHGVNAGWMRRANDT
jgi:putative hydrolase of HD superfamily